MTDNGNKDKDKDEEKDDRSVADVIVDLAIENSSLFFKDQYDMPWVRVHKEDHHELIRIIGNKFKRYIGKLYYDYEKRVPNAEAINGAASVLQAKAEYDGETIPLSLRVAWDNDSDGIIYDLTNKKMAMCQDHKRRLANNQRNTSTFIHEVQSDAAGRTQ